MADVTVLGLGAMGSALAKVLLKAQHRTTVWNRGRAKAELLAQEGALVARTLGEAVSSSSLIIACLDSYATTHALLLSDDIKARLPGRTIVQLSTGSPHEARDALAMFTKEGTSYLDGAIMAYPEEIGQPNAMILLSGSEFTYQNHKQTLGALGGDLRYVGESIGGASALDMALLTYGLGAIIGVTQGAALCESEGVSVDLYGKLFGEQRSLLMGDRARVRAQRIHENRFTDTGASLSVWGAALAGITAHCQKCGLNAEFPLTLSKLFEKAEAAGLGRSDVAALVQVLRPTSRDSLA